MDVLSEAYRYPYIFLKSHIEVVRRYLFHIVCTGLVCILNDCVLYAEAATKAGEGRAKAIRGRERGGTPARAHPLQPQNAHNLAQRRSQIFKTFSPT